MLVENILEVEKEYYADRHESVVPLLMCAYFEEGKYELVYYFAEKYQSVFLQSEFYLMLSLMQLGYDSEAKKIQRKHRDDWFNLCKQGQIYWKHVVLYAVLFKDFGISEYYENQFDDYYEDVLVQLFELLRDEQVCQVVNTECYQLAAASYPKLLDVWKVTTEQRPQLVTFEQVQWNIWKNYNQAIGCGKKYGMETVYDADGIKIYSYKPKDVSASMHILTDGETNIVLDCGCEISDVETIRIQAKEIFSYYGLDHIDAVFISHAHMDHYGSLNEIKRERIYMTSTTRQLIRMASPETVLSSVIPLENYSTVNISGVEVTFIPNGHIRGSVAMDLSWKGKKRIVYTGDYSLDDQRTVAGFNLDDLLLRDEKRIDILLTETTYGNRQGMLTLKQYEKIFVELTRKMIENGNKIIIPCFAIGRSQEVALLIKEMIQEQGKKMLIDGMAARITDYYQADLTESILSKNISICNSELDYAEKIMNNDVILASSGMIKPGSTSARYIEEMIGKENTTVMKVGFIRKEEHMLMSIINRQHVNLHFADIPLSAHVSHVHLLETLERLSPDCAIYVHGGGIEV